LSCCANPRTRETVEFEPFYSFRHARKLKKGAAFWQSARRQSQHTPDGPTDIFLSLVDLSGRPAQPELDTITVRCTCSNGDLPHKLPFGDEAGDFAWEGGVSLKRIRCLRKPTPTLRPALARGELWRLVSHLSLNYLSLVDGGDGLQEILKLYDYSPAGQHDQQIEGIRKVSNRRHFARVVSENGISYVRGTKVEIELDEEKFVGGGIYLFASVIEQFLGQYVSLNSFSQLAITTRQRKGRVKEWPPRAGNRTLL
jgi:type VI secretion system protein ImpG